MPKLKTHSGTKDRVEITKNGKVQVRRSFGNHFLQKKRASRKRGYAGMQLVSGKVTKTIKNKLAR
jgi:ribosomal protein L35